MSSALIRLIDPSDGPALAESLSRDRQAYARWLPARPEEFYTPGGQATVTASLLESHNKGLTWPGVVVTDGAVIVQITISSILRGPFQKGFELLVVGCSWVFVTGL